MKTSRALAIILLAGAALIFAAPGFAQIPTCNLTDPPCGSLPCRQGCAAPIAVFHASSSPCGATPAAGGFDLTATQYRDTCLNGGTCTVDVPPLRFWQYDAYSKANNGCASPTAGAYLANGGADYGIGAPGFWFLYQANWQNPQGDGCVSAANGELRTVAEISFPHAPGEGTVNHKGWYLVASVDLNNDYDFDRIQGGTGCSPATVPASEVPALSIAGHTGSCTGNIIVQTGQPNAVDSVNYSDFFVTLENPSPDYYTESGLSPAGKRLIAGYQILYAGGSSADAAAEPTTSSYATGVWKPVLAPTDPTRALGIVPYGTSGQVQITIPDGACAGTGNQTACPWYWLATRILYVDAGENPANTFDPSTSGPLLASAVSDHCGSLRGFENIAVDFASVAALRTRDGVRVSWQTAREDDTLGFVVLRQALAGPGSESAERLPGFVDARGAYHEYEFLDESVTRVKDEGYIYFVQEMTSLGPGSLSPGVVVDGNGKGRHGGGGRGRGLGGK